MPLGLFECIIGKPIHVKAMSVLAIQTFHETYAPYNTQEDMDAYCNSNFNEEAIQLEVEKEENVCYLIRHKGNFVAYAFVKKENCAIKIVAKPAVEISRIYVLKEYQGKRIGNILIQKMIAFGKDEKCKSIWLGVWKKNINAIEFYKHVGFQICGDTTFKLGSDIQDDYLMYLDLSFL